MAFISTISPSEAAGPVREMYERQQRAWGYVPNYAKIFCHRPEIMKLWADLLRGIRSHIDKRRFEIVTLAAAHELHSSYCSLAHGKALSEFLSEDEIKQLVSGDVDNLSPAEQAMVRLARKVIRNASSVTGDDIAALKEHGISDAEIFDIVAAAAGRAFFASLVDALGTVPDAPFTSFEESFRNSLLVGRPIGDDAPEYLPELEA